MLCVCFSRLFVVLFHVSLLLCGDCTCAGHSPEQLPSVYCCACCALTCLPQSGPQLNNSPCPRHVFCVLSSFAPVCSACIASLYPNFSAQHATRAILPTAAPCARTARVEPGCSQPALQQQTVTCMHVQWRQADQAVECSRGCTRVKTGLANELSTAAPTHFLSCCSVAHAWLALHGAVCSCLGWSNSCRLPQSPMSLSNKKHSAAVGQAAAGQRFLILWPPPLVHQPDLVDRNAACFPNACGAWCSGRRGMG